MGKLLLSRERERYALNRENYPLDTGPKAQRSSVSQNSMTKNDVRTAGAAIVTGSAASLRHRVIREEFDFNDPQFEDVIDLSFLMGEEQPSLFGEDDVNPDLYDVLDEILDVICCARDAQSLVMMAAKQGYALSLGFVDDEGYVLDHENGILHLNNYGIALGMLRRSDYYKNSIAINLIRGLRDIWHEARIGDIYEILNPEHIIKIERFRCADIEAVSAHLIWQLRNDGFSELWRQYMTDQDGDIALSYMSEAENQPDSMTRGKAIRQGFRQWFTDSGRVNAADHDALELMDTMCEERKSKKPFGRQVLNAEQLAGLMALPSSMRYLGEIQDELLSDAFYSGVVDDINQAHLHHILADMEGHERAGVMFQSPHLAVKFFPSKDSLF